MEDLSDFDVVDPPCARLIANSEQPAVQVHPESNLTIERMLKNFLTSERD
jgi:hypothetical protein